MKVISVIAEKGGIGKTTLAQATIELLRAKGYKVLAIDTDQQANLSYALNIDKAPFGLYELLTKKKPITQVIYNDAIKATEEISLLTKEAKISLRDALKPINNKYDYVILDTPPKLDINIARALNATDYAILPTSADAFSNKGLDKIIKHIADTKAHTNKNIQIAGVIFNMYNDRNTLSKQLKEIITNKCKKQGIYTFKTTINKNIAIAEAQALRQPLAEYNNKSKAIKDLKAYINELETRLKGGK